MSAMRQKGDVRFPLNSRHPVAHRGGRSASLNVAFRAEGQSPLWAHGCAKVVTTDGLRSYKAAMKELGIAERQEIGRWANNRVENSHQPFRRRERAMLRFRRMKTLQQFASVHDHFNQERHLVSRETYKERRSAALAEWPAVAS